MKDRSRTGEAERIGGYLDGTLSDVEFARFEEDLRRDPAMRDRYLEAVRMDTLLRQIAGAPGEDRAPRERRRISRAAILVGIGALGCAAALFLVLDGIVPAGTVAEIGATAEVRWPGSPRAEGEKLRREDEIELAAGEVEIRFRSGALTRLYGPARFEVRGSNAGFLHHGRAWSRADTASSEGFTLETPSGRFVDRGTEFLTRADADGFSQMQVSSGAVDAEVRGFERQRLERGSGLGIEPGEETVLIQIESGDETPAFRFPTIPPPTDRDHADLSAGKARVLLSSRDEKRGRDNLPHPKSGPPELLIDGKTQTGKDEPAESFYFPDGAEGGILLDLGTEIPVGRVHTYSWHLNDVFPDIRRRAVQRYTLWGTGRSLPEHLPTAENRDGWTRIARVDTDAFFQVEEEPDRPAQQACAIRSSASSLGSYRYLLFQVVPTPMSEAKRDRHTFFGEIDVLAAEWEELPIEN